MVPIQTLITQLFSGDTSTSSNRTSQVDMSGFAVQYRSRVSVLKPAG